jgi:hypothetical protein
MCAHSNTESTRIDPDVFREALPEWEGYVKRNPLTAGRHTQEESGYIAEIAREVAMSMERNVLFEGSLRNAEWHMELFKEIREKHPRYRILIVHVYADMTTVVSRCCERGSRTGRKIPLDCILDSIQQVERSVKILRPLADGIIRIDNSK